MKVTARQEIGCLPWDHIWRCPDLGLRQRFLSARNSITQPWQESSYGCLLHGLFGGFGNYFVVIFQGSPEVVYPRVNNFSILILSLSYLFLILSLISPNMLPFNSEFPVTAVKWFGCAKHNTVWLVPRPAEDTYSDSLLMSIKKSSSPDYLLPLQFLCYHSGNHGRVWTSWEFISAASGIFIQISISYLMMQR